MLTAKILRADVLENCRTDRISIAAPDDFILTKAAVMDSESIHDVGLLPYCIDLLRRRCVYVGGVDARAAQDAPFYYLHLRRHARFVVSVPWPARADGDGSSRAPVFLFSPGRCGSTLLSAILSAAHIANVSEPDFYTQAAWRLCASPLSPLHAPVRRAAAQMGAELCAALSPQDLVVAKLRAEACKSPEMLLAGERRTIFMIRDFESWVRSTGRAFRNGPRKMVRKYINALACQAYLRRSSDCHLLRYETLTADPAAACRALGTFLETPIALEAVVAAMASDAQRGTPLARDARSDVPDWERRLEQTLALWNSDRVMRRRDALASGG